jgi:hypothetical protein
MEEVTMSQTKAASKRKRAIKVAVPALGAAGLGLSFVGAASAATAPTTADAPKTLDLSATHPITLNDEELADTSLATFHLFDKENAGGERVMEARGCGGCRGCRGCRGCGGCRGCRGCGCGGCGGCAGCCLSWGGCRLC